MRDDSLHTTSHVRLQKSAMGLIGLSVSIVVFIFASSVMKIPSRYRIATQGVTVKGSIVTKDPQAHGGQVTYMYKVDSESYSDVGGVGNFDDTDIGDQVTVVYDPTNPAISTIAQPSEDFWQLLILAVVFSVVSGFLAMLSAILVLKIVRK